jgi:DNA-binding transcriptional LysR family regulator
MLDNLGLEASFEALRRGEIDLAAGRFTTSRPGFDLEPLYEDRYCIIARRDHPQFKRRMTLKQYRSAGHIFSYSPGEGGEAGEAERTVHVRYHAVVPRWLTVLTLVAASDAIGTVPRRLAERHADVLGLRIIEAPFVGQPIPVGMVRRAGRPDPGLDWFYGQVKKAAR